MIRSLSWTFFIIGPIGLLSFDTFAISSEDDEKARTNSSPYAFSGKPTEDSIAPEDLNRFIFTTSGAQEYVETHSEDMLLQFLRSSANSSENSETFSENLKTFDRTTLCTLCSFLLRLPSGSRPYCISRLVPIIQREQEDGNSLTQINSGALPNDRNFHFQLIFNFK